MPRSIPAPLLAAMSAAIVKPAIFVEAEFAAATVRVWSGYGDMTAGGQTWSGAGSLLDVSLIGETQEVRAQGVTVTLSGIPSEMLAIALGENYHGRIARIYLGFFADEEPAETVLIADTQTARYQLRDRTTLLLSDLHPLFSGRMDVMSVIEGPETATVTLSIENRLIDLERPAPVLYTEETQQRLFPGDRGLEFVEGLTDVTVTWGRG
jgi:hypothetical protein